ncbi:MAG: tetratricopeptide repeat protein [Sciscionella sp.]
MSEGPNTGERPGREATSAADQPALAEPTPTSIVSAPTSMMRHGQHPVGPPPRGIAPPQAVGGRHAMGGQAPPAQPTQAVNPDATSVLRGAPDAAAARAALGSSGHELAAVGGEGSSGAGRASEARGTGTRGSGRSRRMSGRTSQRSSRRMRIGNGLVEVTRPALRDPAEAIMQEAEVAENKRYCGNCGKPVGRGAGGRPGSTEGICQNCDTAFSFSPKLFAGDLVAGQYEVLGCLAHGGLGWIYLATDRNVSDRWVVLKGLIDTGDPSAMAAAVAEQQFLAEVEHPNIVKIYNFVQHPDPQTGNQVGYIVMEYIGGQSLREAGLSNKDATGKHAPLPLAQVLAYGLEMLPALGYLHNTGLLYCDLKPDNVIQTHEGLKLIDLGAVRRIDDWDSPIFFTSGYSAPELATDGPSIASDIYTVGRMLAVMSFDFGGYTSKFQYSLPGRDAVPLFALFESYYRLLRRATDPKPERRFNSCEEMADQLLGVLREVIALSTKEPRPGRSAAFGAELRTFGSEVMTVTEHRATPRPPEWAEVTTGLPKPQVDTSDAAAGVLGTTTTADPRELLTILAAAPPNSVEAKLARARLRIEMGDLHAANQDLNEAAAIRTDAEGGALPPNWRVDWYRGLLSLAARRPRDARVAFDAVYDMVPGELAPKLALAISAEYCGDFFPAARLYELVWHTDHGYVSAAFGLARVYLAQGDRAGALDVLESVPDRSSQYLAAQLAAITTRTRAVPANQLVERDLLLASTRLERLSLDAERRIRSALEILGAAHDWVNSGAAGQQRSNGGRVLGCGLNDRELRFGLERNYRSLARFMTTQEDRYALVDKANDIRPRTLT